MKITNGNFMAMYSQNKYMDARLLIRLDDTVDGNILKNATEKTARRYPYLCMKIVRDKDDYCTEDNPLPIKILNQKEPGTLLSEETNYHIWSVCYKDDFIYVDMFHGIVDGNQAYRVLSTLLFYYMNERYGDVEPEDILTLDVPISEEETADPFEDFPVPEEVPGDAPPVRKERPFIASEDGETKKAEHYIYDLALNEEDFVRLASENETTPGNLISLLAARAMNRAVPSNRKTTLGMYFINCRPMIGAKNCYYNCVTFAEHEYSNEVKGLSFKEQCKLYRSETRRQSDKDYIIKSLGMRTLAISKFKEIPTIEGKEDAMTKLITALAPGSSYGISYIGKWRYKSLEKHIKEFWTHVIGHSDICIQIAAVNGKFFISFHQELNNEKYINAFIEELESFGISCTVVHQGKADVKPVLY